MLNDLLPFKVNLDTTAIAASCLWSLALYLSFSSVRDRIVEGLNRWFNFAREYLYTSAEELTKNSPARESPNTFYASLFSIIPFLAVGGICNWGVEVGLGRSWSVSMGILACIAGGIYELGRQDSQKS
jgi:hypothetical protein